MIKKVMIKTTSQHMLILSSLAKRNFSQIPAKGLYVVQSFGVFINVSREGIINESSLSPRHF